MKSLFSKYVWLQLVLSILLLFSGSLIIAFAISGRQNVLRDGLNLVVAITLFIFGLFAILTAFIFEYRKVLTAALVYGSICIALGVLLCNGIYNKNLYLLDFIVLLLSVFFIVIGVIELVKGIIMLLKKTKETGIAVAALVVGLGFIALGIISIIYRNQIVNAFCILAGVLLVAVGVYELIMGIRTLAHSSKNRGSKKSTKPARADQEVKELDYTKE